MDGRYILVELPIGFSATNRRRAYDATHDNIGLHEEPYPNRNTHGRPSLNGSKFIMEGIFTDGEIDKDALAEMLGPILGLPIPPIKATMVVVVFSGDNWKECNQSARNYVTANIDDWDEGE